jgi:hypothetical protein
MQFLIDRHLARLDPGFPVNLPKRRTICVPRSPFAGTLEP